MKRQILIFVCVASVPFAFARESAAADPVTFVAKKTAHVAHTVASGFNRHVVQPARRTIAHRMP
jgi:hypothetical protein